MDTLTDVIVSNIRGRRAEMQLTQQEVADRSGGGISRAALASVERNERVLRIDELPGICAALKCGIRELMTGSNDLYLLFPHTSASDSLWMVPTPAPTPSTGALWAALEPKIRELVRETMREAFDA